MQKHKKNESFKDELKLENQVCFPLYSAANAIVRAYRPLLEPLGLTYLQYLAMMVLWSSDGINVKELGNCLYLDSGTITPLLKRLESKGLIIRKHHKLDERMKKLYLTPAGINLKQRAREVPKAISCNLDIELSDLNQLKHLCENLILTLNKP